MTLICSEGIGIKQSSVKTSLNNHLLNLETGLTCTPELTVCKYDAAEGAWVHSSPVHIEKTVGKCHFAKVSLIKGALLGTLAQVC